MRPPVQRRVLDPRRTTQPTAEPRFSPSHAGDSEATDQGTVYFDGPVQFRKIAAMTFRSRYQRKLMIRALMLVSLWAMFAWLCSGFERVAARVAGPALLGVYFIVTLVRMFSQIRSIEESEMPLFWSKGWINENEFVSITRTGQCRFRWPYFSEVEMIDEAIQMKSKHAAKWYFVTRDQFDSDEKWNAARDLINSKIAS